jgi:hypothetical protein
MLSKHYQYTIASLIEFYYTHYSGDSQVQGQPWLHGETMSQNKQNKTKIKIMLQNNPIVSYMVVYLPS